MGQFCYFCDMKHSAQCVRMGKFEIADISKLKQRSEIDARNLLLMHKSEQSSVKTQSWGDGSFENTFFPSQLKKCWVLSRMWCSQVFRPIQTTGLNLLIFFAQMWYIISHIAQFSKVCSFLRHHYAILSCKYSFPRKTACFKLPFAKYLLALMFFKGLTRGTV